MVKKFFLLAILFVFIFLASGCCTVVRSTTGAVGGFAMGTIEGSKEGFKEDLGLIEKADNWVKENLW